MACRATCFALMLATLPLAGCGTVANLANSRTEEGGRIPYGGTKHDLACLRGAANGDFGYRAHTKSRSDAEDEYPRTALTLLCAVDLPLSAVADTVCWPYTCAYTNLNQPVSYPPVAVGDVLPPQGGTASGSPAATPTPPKPPIIPPPAPPETAPAPTTLPAPVGGK